MARQKDSAPHQQKKYKMDGDLDLQVVNRRGKPFKNEKVLKGVPMSKRMCTQKIKKEETQALKSTIHLKRKSQEARQLF